MILSIVRHGRTSANATGLLQGHTDNPLDEAGIQQAAQVCEALLNAEVPVDRVVSSPLSRARDTAAVIANARGLKIETDDRWIELNYGDWEQRRAADVSLQEWKAWRDNPDYAPPGGESLIQLDARVRRACEDLANNPAGEHVAVFSHVSPIKAAVAWSLGVDPLVSFTMSWRMFVGQAQISTIAVASEEQSSFAGRPKGAARLVEFNSTTHLG